MSRLPLIDRDALAPEGQAVWDRIAAVAPECADRSEY